MAVYQDIYKIVGGFFSSLFSTPFCDRLQMLFIQKKKFQDDGFLK